MYYNDLLTKLTYLTKNNNLTHKEIGEAINVERRAMSGRAERNSKFKDAEIKSIEKYFNINLSDISIIENTFEQQNDILTEEKASKFNIRLIELQARTGLSDKDFALTLNLDEDELIEYKNADRKPNLKIILAVKQHYKISLDWLILGD